MFIVFSNKFIYVPQSLLAFDQFQLVVVEFFIQENPMFVILEIWWLTE